MQYFDFYQYWNMYHASMNEDNNGDCDFRDVMATCEDFEMLEGECGVYISYSPCVYDHFICELSR
jgi:hypothetical protein